MSSKKELEEGARLELDFNKLEAISLQAMKVIPVVLQHAVTKDVLYVAYLNRQALLETLDASTVVLWSTSKNKIWRKGETSGDVLDVVEIRVNCDQNSLLFLVRPRQTGVCHTKDVHGRTRPTCFYRVMTARGNLEFVP